MLDLDRFVDVAEGEIVPWHICAKVGTSNGHNDGDLVQAYPATPGIDSYGAAYAGIIGRKTLTGFAVLEVNADRETIRNLFAIPHKNSNAYKYNRNNYSFIDFDDIFTMAEVSFYRDHTRQVPILKNFNVARISDYRERPERLTQALPHGSVDSGTYTVGGVSPSPDYDDLKLAMDDVGTVGSNTLEFVIIGANSPGANIDFDKTTNADGLIYIHSTLYGYRSNPLITGGGKWWQLDGNCNYLIEHINVNGISLHYDSPTTGSTGRLHTFRCNVFDVTTNHDPFFPDIDEPGIPLRIEFYGNVIFGRSTTARARCENIIVGSGWTSSTWAENIYFENNTLICDYDDYSEAAIDITGTDINTSFYNNVVYQSIGTRAWKNTLATGTATLNNCARNKALLGSFTENNCIIDLIASDFLSVTIAENDCGKIDHNSRLFKAGVNSGNIPGYTRDIVGDYVSADAPAMGAFQAVPGPRTPFASLALIDVAAQHTTIEIDMSEHITGMSQFSGDVYFKSFFKDEIKCVSGDKIMVHKILTRLEVDGVKYTKVYALGDMLDTTFYQDIPNEILYLQIGSGETPNSHTVVGNFPMYFSENGLRLPVEIIMAEHNDLEVIQGGISTERFHLTEAQHNLINNADTSWTAPSLLNNWVNHGEGYEIAGYMLDGAGFVHLKGLLKDGTINNDIFILPVGYRPSLDKRFPIISTVTTSPSHIRIFDDTGAVRASVGANTWLSLDGITFRAEQ